MNERKKHVIETAHKLFIEKGFQATSIQDILEYSGISKGTFYNYFSSKNELLIALFTMIYKKMDEERRELLVGQDPSDIHIFIKQVELQMKTNRANNLISLFEEVFFSKDEDLKDFVKMGQLKMLSWVYLRFIDIFGVDKKPYLLDCTVMFSGILNHNLKYYSMAYGLKDHLYEVVEYSVNRVVKMVEEVSTADVQLLKPELIEKWLPNNNSGQLSIEKSIEQTIIHIKKTIIEDKLVQLLDFIQEELIYTSSPRIYIIESALNTLDHDEFIHSHARKEFQKLQTLISEYLTAKETP
jgi:hypothetical protein